MTADILSFLLHREDANHVAVDFLKDSWPIIIIFMLLVYAMSKMFTFIQSHQFFFTAQNYLENISHIYSGTWLNRFSHAGRHTAKTY